MVEQFRRSGLTRKAFCVQYGVPLATLSWWLSKAKHTSSAAAVAFREIKVIPTAEPPQKWAMEIESPSGVKVRCREVLPAGTLERLLRGPLC